MDRSAGNKLILGTVIVVSLSLVSSVTSLVVVSNLGSHLDRAVHANARQQLLAGQIATAASELDGLVRGLAMALTLQQRSGVEQHRADLGRIEQQMESGLREFRGLASNSETRALLDRLQSEFDGFRQLHAQMTRSLEAHKMEEAMGLLNSSLLPRLAQMNEAAKKALDDQGRQLAVLRESSASTRAVSSWTMVGFGLICLVVGIGVVVNVRSVSTALRESVDDLSSNARNLSETSRQVSDTSQQVSQAASEQAASLEETSASAEEIHAMTRRNAEHAESAARRSQESAQVIEEANRVLGQMITSMNEISSSSGKISKIIKVIEDIAFQTNILALNAAVEAARAGEAGMGFAVVADEVRNLAQRSAQAAKDTTQLIEESIARSSEGKRKLDEMAQAIASVTENGTRVKDLVDEVNRGSEQQAKGIEQIATAVARMEQVTQQLAASAQQSAAAGQQLQRHAQQVDAIGQSMEALVGQAQGGTVAVAAPRRQVRSSVVAPAQRIALRPPAAVSHAAPVAKHASIPAAAAAPAGRSLSGSFQKPSPMDHRDPESIIPFENDFKEV